MHYDDWILEQMAVPAGLHRVYYRERVNPRTKPGISQASEMRTTCTHLHSPIPEAQSSRLST